MAKTPSVEATVPDPTTLKIESLADYALRGWLYFSRQTYDLAIQDFRHIVDTDGLEIDAWYGLGLALKNAQQPDQALQAFERVLALLPRVQDGQRASILGRLTKGQINQIKTGDWNLEKEVWKTV